MGKLAWCLGKDKGIRLVEPSETISSAYVKSSQESLDAMQKNTGRWRTVAAYYACYESLYALLAKAGIKSEIHECTLALMDLFGFSRREMRFLSELKGERVAVQYYLQQPKALDEKGVKSFVAACRSLLSGLSEDAVAQVRAVLRKEMTNIGQK